MTNLLTDHDFCFTIQTRSFRNFIFPRHTSGEDISFFLDLHSPRLKLHFKVCLNNSFIFLLSSTAIKSDEARKTLRWDPTRGFLGNAKDSPTILQRFPPTRAKPFSRLHKNFSHQHTDRRNYSHARISLGSHHRHRTIFHSKQAILAKRIFQRGENVKN